MAARETALIGTIGRAHGLRGDVTMQVRTDEPERRFAPGASVLIGTRPARIKGHRWHSGVLLVTFEGVADRTAAEALRGSDVWAEVDADEPTADDEFYDRHLIGLTVKNAAGEPVGTVDKVLHLPAQDCLAVNVDGVERLIPFVEALVPVVDLDAGFVQVADVRGLLEDPE